MRKTTKGQSREPRRCPASLSPAASERMKLFPLGWEGLSGCASTQPRLARGEQKPLAPMSASWRGGLRGSPSGSGHNLRGSARRPSPASLRATQNFAHTAAAARPLFSASRTPPSAAAAPPQPPLPLRSRRCPASGSRLFPRCLQFPPRGLPRGCGRAAPSRRWAGGAGAAFQMTTSPGPGSTHGTDWSARPSPPRSAHPEPPAPSQASATPSPTFQPLRTTLSAQPS